MKIFSSAAGGGHAAKKSIGPKSREGDSIQILDGANLLLARHSPQADLCSYYERQFYAVQNAKKTQSPGFWENFTKKNALQKQRIF